MHVRVYLIASATKTFVNSQATTSLLPPPVLAPATGAWGT